MTSKSPVGDISVVTLIRTDTTLDHSQKAEKVWGEVGPRAGGTFFATNWGAQWVVGRASPIMGRSLARVMLTGRQSVGSK